MRGSRGADSASASTSCCASLKRPSRTSTSPSRSTKRDVVGVGLERLPVDLERLFGLLARLVHEAERHPRGVHVGIELDGALEARDRLVPLLALDGHAPEQVLRLGRVGLDRDQPQQHRARLVVLASARCAAGRGRCRRPATRARAGWPSRARASASAKRRWRRKMSASVRWGVGSSGSSAMAFFAASTASAGSLARASHWASCTHSAAVPGRGRWPRGARRWRPGSGPRARSSGRRSSSSTRRRAGRGSARHRGGGRSPRRPARAWRSRLRSHRASAAREGDRGGEDDPDSGHGCSEAAGAGRSPRASKSLVRSRLSDDASTGSATGAAASSTRRASSAVRRSRGRQVARPSGGDAGPAAALPSANRSDVDGRAVRARGARPAMAAERSVSSWSHGELSTLTSQGALRERAGPGASRDLGPARLRPLPPYRLLEHPLGQGRDRRGQQVADAHRTTTAAACPS